MKFLFQDCFCGDGFMKLMVLRNLKLPPKVSSQDCNCPAQPQFFRKLGLKYPVPPLSCLWSLEVVLMSLVG